MASARGGRWIEPVLKTCNPPMDGASAAATSTWIFCNGNCGLLCQKAKLVGHNAADVIRVPRL